MATVTRRCKNEKCKRRFRISAQSRRLFCEECRPPRTGAGAVLDPVPAPVGDGGAPGPVEAAALAQLEAVQRHESVAGVLVLALARDIDSGAVSPAQKGAAGEKLVRLLAEATRGTTPPRSTDRLDEIAARRAEKARAAS